MKKYVDLYSLTFYPGKICVSVRPTADNPHKINFLKLPPKILPLNWDFWEEGSNKTLTKERINFGKRSKGI